MIPDYSIQNNLYNLFCFIYFTARDEVRVFGKFIDYHQNTVVVHFYCDIFRFGELYDKVHNNILLWVICDLCILNKFIGCMRLVFIQLIVLAFINITFRFLFYSGEVVVPKKQLHCLQDSGVSLRRVVVILTN